MNFFKKIFGKKNKNEKATVLFEGLSLYEVETRIVNWCKKKDIKIDYIRNSGTVVPGKLDRVIECSTILSEHNKEFIDISPDRFWGIVITGNKLYTTPNKPRAKLMFEMFIVARGVKVQASSWAENPTPYGKTAVVHDYSDKTREKLIRILQELGGVKI